MFLKKSLIVLELVKIGLAAMVGYALLYPFFLPQPVGLAKELATLGLEGAILLGLVFFSFVVLYARDLASLLKLISPAHRHASPRSVWWMLVLPYNFIEDFFIIYSVSKSIQSEYEADPNLPMIQVHGAITGIGWCVAQIGSLLPNDVGSLSGLLAFIFWVIHWRFIRQVMQQLKLRASNNRVLFS